MKKYLLIGTYMTEEREDDAKCIDIIMRENDQEAYDGLGEYIWLHHKENLEKYDTIFLISDDLKKIIGRASNFTSVDYLRIEIQQSGDLKDYKPVYVDIAEYDERVHLSNVLDVDLV